MIFSPSLSGEKSKPAGASQRPSLNSTIGLEISTGQANEWGMLQLPHPLQESRTEDRFIGHAKLASHAQDIFFAEAEFFRRVSSSEAVGGFRMFAVVAKSYPVLP